MKFNVFFQLRGPAGVVEVPNRDNPAEADDLSSLLAQLSVRLPYSKEIDLQTIGVRIEMVPPEPMPEVPSLADEPTIR